MDPEEPFMPSIAMTFANSTPGIFIEELANHCLRDSMDYGGVRRSTVQTRAIGLKVATWRDGDIRMRLGPINKNAMIGRQ